MLIQLRRIALPLLLGVLALGISSYPADVRATTKSDSLTKAWEDVKDFAMDQKEKAVQEGQRIMESFDVQMARLEADASRDKAEMTEDWQKTKAQLADLRAKAESHLEQLEGATDETWEDVKRGFGSALQELENAYRDARSNIDSETE